MSDKEERKVTEKHTILKYPQIVLCNCILDGIYHLSYFKLFFNVDLVKENRNSRKCSKNVEDAYALVDLIIETWDTENAYEQWNWVTIDGELEKKYDQSNFR